MSLGLAAGCRHQNFAVPACALSFIAVHGQWAIATAGATTQYCFYASFGPSYDSKAGTLPLSLRPRPLHAPLMHA